MVTHGARDWMVPNLDNQCRTVESLTVTSCQPCGGNRRLRLKNDLAAVGYGEYSYITKSVVRNCNPWTGPLHADGTGA